MRPPFNSSPSPLPYHCYFFPVVISTIAGLADTIYLAYSHYHNYTDTTYASFCAISKAINCDTVSQSPWSIMLGLPVAIWGMIAYLFFFIILIPARRNTPETVSLWSILFILSLVYSIAALLFGYISSTKIHSYCLMCIISYGLSFMLLFYSWLIRRRFCHFPLSTSIKKGLRILHQSAFVKTAIALLVSCVILLQLFLPHYWQYDFLASTKDIRTGMTEEGSPWIGAENPKLTIEEYSDYLCFQCNKMHFHLRRLVAEHPDTIRLVHHHYPMDHEFNPIVVPEPFHEGSGKMALLAIYAAFKHKFWAMNDVLFELGQKKESISTEVLEEKTGIPSTELVGALQHPTIRLILQNDIRKGMKLEITGTPTFGINGETYQGYIPAEILEKATR